MSKKKKYNNYKKTPPKKVDGEVALKKTHNSKYDMFAIAAMFYAMWTTIVTPLWLEDQYFNQTAAKGHAFYVGAGIMIVLIGIACISKMSLKPLVPRKNLAEISMIAFGVLAFISSLMSEYTRDSLIGNQGWWVGGIPMLLFPILVIYLSNTIKFNKLLIRTMIVIGLIVFFIDILHCAGIDVFFLHRNMLEGQLWIYMSTIGNIDWHIAYICLTVPIILMLFMKEEERNTAIAYGVYLLFACMGMVLVRADGLYLGLGLCAFFAVPFVMKNAQRLRRFLLVIGFYATSVIIVQFAPMFENTRIGGGVVGLFAKPFVAIAMLVAGYGGYAVLKFGIKEISEKFSKIAIIVAEAVLVAAVIYFVIDTIKNFGEGWGSLRGLIWIDTINLFKERPLLTQLMGLGPETLRVFNDPINQHYGATVLTNHSDFFQFLVTNGIIGLLAWLAMWAGIIIRQIKSKNIEDEAFIFFICLIAYLGQSAVFTAECLSWPMLILVMGLFLRYDKERQPVQAVIETEAEEQE